MSDPLDVCPQCSDPWCSCDCALCDFVTSSKEACDERTAYKERMKDKPGWWQYHLTGADRSALNGRELRMRYYREVVEVARDRAEEG